MFPIVRLVLNKRNMKDDSIEIIRSSSPAMLHLIVLKEDLLLPRIRAQFQVIDHHNRPTQIKPNTPNPVASRVTHKEKSVKVIVASHKG